jgi:hypothetical protein
MYAPSIQQLSLPELQAAFLSLRSRILTHAQFIFRDVACADRKAECISETIALAWKWFLRLVEKGKDPRRFASVLAGYTALAVKNGRRLCGQLRAKDVMNPVAQRRHGFKLETLPCSTRTCQEDRYGVAGGQRRQDEFEERLRDNTRTPPDEQAMFRLDFAAWLSSLTTRERKIVRAMARNERTRDLSHQFDVSPGRISQLRRDFALSWRKFCAEAGPEKARVMA